MVYPGKRWQLLCRFQGPPSGHGSFLYCSATESFHVLSGITVYMFAAIEAVESLSQLQAVRKAFVSNERRMAVRVAGCRSVRGTLHGWCA